MTEIGRLAGIHRYPVKSMLGEMLAETSLGANGIPGDRAWGVRDEQRGDFFVGKRSAALMGCRASWPSGFGAGRVPTIELPDGDRFAADDPDAARRVARVVGREVTLWPVVPAARQARPTDGLELADEMRTLMGRAEDEPLPDFSTPPPALAEFQARGGPFFDASPLLLLTQRSLDSLAAAATGSRIDARRFRPSLLVETDASDAHPGSDWPEQAWIGQRLRLGEAVLAIQSTCARCVMTTHGFADLPKDPRVMRALVRETDGNLGVYATIETPGRIRVGDRLDRLD